MSTRKAPKKVVISYCRQTSRGPYDITKLREKLLIKINGNNQHEQLKEIDINIYQTSVGLLCLP